MPGTSKKVVRKVRTGRVADFDDQMWPINCAILILAGFAAGIAIATGDWHAENLLYNTIFRLIVIAAAVAVVFVAMVRLQRKMIRRVQLCVLVSLLVHLWLGLVLHQRYIAFVLARQEAEAARRLVDEEPRLIVPEYHWENIERPESRHTFEEPVATEAPKATEPEPIEPKQLEHDVPADKKPRTEPSPPQPQQPNPAEVRRAELTAPRRAPLAAGAQISRQEWKHDLEPNEPIPEPEAPARVEEAAAEPAAAAAVEPRRIEAPRHEREMSESVPRAMAKQDAMKLARRAAPAEPLPDAPTTPTPTRQLTRPADVARTELAAPPPTAPVATPDARLTPTPSALTPRATAAAPEQSAGRELPAMTPATQLPASVARRAEASLPEPAPERLAASRPSTLERAQTGIDLPAVAMPMANAAASPAATGGAPSSRIEATGPLAVTRTASEAPTGTTVAAAGAVEFAIGSSPAAARRGQPRAVGAAEPSVASNASASAIARSTAPGTSLSAAPVPATMPAPEGAPAASAGAAVRPTANARATAAARGGSASIPTDRPSAASGPVVASSGTPGRIGLAQPARVTRHESVASGVSGGGTPSPARALGRAIAPKGTIDAPQVPATAAVEGKAGGSPLEAPAGAPPRQVAGLPGSLPAQAMAGAVASLSAPGMAAPTAAARRAAASQIEPGGDDSSPNAGATVARSERGTHLPSPAATLPELPTAGAAGVGTAPGGALSRLEEGATAAVRRAVGAGIVASKTVAAGDAEFAVGAATVATPSGTVHAADQGVPNLAADNTVRAVGRTAISGDLARDAAPIDALPTVPDGASPDGRGASAGVTASPAPASDAVASSRPTAGLPGELAADRMIAEARTVGPSATTPGTIAGARRLPHGDDPGPTLAAETSGGPLRKTNTPGLLRGLAGSIEAQPGTAAGTDEATPRPEAADVADLGAAARQPGGLPVEIAAKTGPGGLSYEPSPQVGIPNRHARPESEVVHTLSRRFVVARSGGRVAIDGQVQELPAEAFRRRDPGQRARAIEIYGGTEGTERAVEMGLEFFVRCQFPDGHWSLNKLPETLAAEQPGLGQMGSDSAATGLALLSFLGAGYTHQSDKHRATVRRGLDWLAGHQKPDGDLFTGGSDYTWFYSHGIATIALCEAYGMTRDPQLREPAQKAVGFIVAAQSPSRGGWRYEPREETDTSVSGWQLMALKSAQMAGLKVPKETLDRVSGWLDAAQSEGGARYAYNPFAGDTPAQLPGRRPNLAMTAEGALMRMYLGRKSDNPALVGAADYLKENLPEVGTAERPTRDAYYWYYATQVMFQMRGDYWEAWNTRLHPLLESSQDQTGALAGSWNPDAPIRDRWAHAGGRVYVTAMHLLMLEVYYRHLPLFQPLEE